MNYSIHIGLDQKSHSHQFETKWWRIAASPSVGPFYIVGNGFVIAGNTHHESMWVPPLWPTSFSVKSPEVSGRRS